MEFEIIGGDASSRQYSLYDYSTYSTGETVMSIDVHHESGEWRFVGPPLDNLTPEHMKALSHLLQDLLKGARYNVHSI